MYRLSNDCVEEWMIIGYSQLRRVKGEVTAKRIARNHSGGRRQGRKRKGVVAKEMKFFRGNRDQDCWCHLFRAAMYVRWREEGGVSYPLSFGAGMVYVLSTSTHNHLAPELDDDT